jgi:selenocysteine-specific elongation factor
VHGLERDELARGMVLVQRGEMEASSVIDVDLAILPLCPAPVKSRAKILFHALTTQESGTLLWHEGRSVEPGGRALAQLHLEKPVALLPGDRFILRGFRTLPGYGTTIGGGRVVRVQAPKRRRGGAEALALLRAMAAATAPDERIALEIEAAGAAGIDRATLRARVGEGARTIDRALESLLSKRVAVTFHREAGAVVSAAALGALGAAVSRELERFHAAHPLLPGVAREELRTSVAPTRSLDPRLFAVLIADLARRGAIDLVGADQVRRAGFSPRKAEAEKDLLVSKVIAIYRKEGLAPPWSGELAARIGATPAEAAAALEILIRRGDLVRVKPDLCFDREAITALAGRLRQYLDSAGQITPQQWKELTGQTRKFAIPLAEHFDAERLTLRIGDVRKLRG